jgi:hypothetical protein
VSFLFLLNRLPASSGKPESSNFLFSFSAVHRFEIFAFDWKSKYAKVCLFRLGQQNVRFPRTSLTFDTWNPNLPIAFIRLSDYHGMVLNHQVASSLLLIGLYA